MKRILIAPLDWGLGHATRCIPVIRELQRQGGDVLIAGSGDSLRLLEREFPRLKTFAIPAYRPRYPRRGSMVLSMAAQLPHFIRVIREEHRVATQIVEQENIDILISDNRYGCWSPQIPSVFITHQSNILMPRRFGWLQPVVRRLSDRLINRFTLCWIPDLPGDDSLAGRLVSFGGARVNIRKEYIGWLSRFTPRPDVTRQYDIVAVFSGPEPQRTMLENTVLPQLRNTQLRYKVARGLPGHTDTADDDCIADFLDSGKLQEAIEAADIIIARSGFSTVMDLQALGKKAVFIPTPGQTEQEYLASRLMDQGIAFSMSQDQFSLDTALARSKDFSGFRPHQADEHLAQAVSRLFASSR